jgi:hypothetical protein
VRPTHLLDRLGELVARGAGVDGGLGGEGQEQVLGRDVLVTEAAGLLVGSLEQADQRLAERGRARLAGDGVKRVERLVHAPAYPLGIRPGAPEHRHDDAAVLLEQGDEEVLRRDLRVVARARKPLSGRKRLLRLDRESVCLHKI